MSNCNDNWKGRDKIKHFSICFVLSIISPILAICIAVLKELYDAEIEGNHFCWKDIVADVVGIIVRSALYVGSLMKRVSKEATRRDGDGDDVINTVIDINSQILLIYLLFLI